MNRVQLLDPVAAHSCGLEKIHSVFFGFGGSGDCKLGVKASAADLYLCHPSLKNDEQAIAEARINGFLTEVYAGLLDGGCHRAGTRGVLTTQLRTIARCRYTPTFDVVKQTIILQHLPGRRLLVINARVKRQGIAYGRGLNFLIGGKYARSGAASRSATYSSPITCETPRISQIDTMHQHARMYGYRGRTLNYTRLFIPRHLYYRFRDIHSSDQRFAGFHRRPSRPASWNIPIEFTFNLRTTRPGVLDVNKIDTLNPESRSIRIYVIIPQEQRAYGRVLGLLGGHFGVQGGTEAQIEAVSTNGVQISADAAVALVSPIKTRSRTRGGILLSPRRIVR